MGLSNTAVPKYYKQFRDQVIAGKIPVCENISKEMNRIDEEIKREEYRKAHPEEFENLETAEESLQCFFDMIGGC